MGNSIKNILIIGDGVAAWAMQYELASLAGVKVYNYSADEFFPACSYRTTSINCLRGTQKGISELGDLIFDSYEVFESIIKENDFSGVFEGFEYQTWDKGDDEKWSRRYDKSEVSVSDDFLASLIGDKKYFVKNPAYFIDPKKLKTDLLKNSNVNHLNEVVLSISEDNLVTTNKSSKPFDYIINCAGFKSYNLFKGFNAEYDYYHEHSKPVAGSFLETDIKDLKTSFNENFNIVVNGHHFIYRKDQGVLQIGSTTENKSDIFLPRTDLLESIYKEIKTYLKIELPSFDSFTPVTGVRHKGYKRKPFMGRLDAKKFALNGLYKNGFTFSFLGAKRIAEELKDEIEKNKVKFIYTSRLEIK